MTESAAHRASPRLVVVGLITRVRVFGFPEHVRDRLADGKGHRAVHRVAVGLAPNSVCSGTIYPWIFSSFTVLLRVLDILSFAALVDGHQRRQKVRDTADDLLKPPRAGTRNVRG